MTLEEQRQFLVPTTTKPDDGPLIAAEKTENWPVGQARQVHVLSVQVAQQEIYGHLHVLYSRYSWVIAIEHFWRTFWWLYWQRTSNNSPCLEKKEGLLSYTPLQT